MPTTRLGRVRHFLEAGEAKIVNYEPFTIQLLRDSTEYVQELNLGCDPGYENTAISVTSKDKEVYSEQYIHTTDMSDNLTRRAKYKRNRRSRKTRRRKARFNNRKNRASKLAPSMEHLRGTIKREIESVCRILPVSKIYIENVKYDAQKALNHDIQGEEYQHGFKYDYDSQNIKECVRRRDNNTCQICHEKCTNEPGKRANVHHLLPVSKGGTNTPGNLVTLCEYCHQKLHAGKVQYKGTAQNKSLLSIPLTALNIIKNSLVKKLREKYDNVYTTDGVMTKIFRSKAGLEKHHTYDALVISHNHTAEPLEYVLVKRQVRRHQRDTHKFKFSKGGTRQIKTCNKYIIPGAKFTKYDCVLCKGNIGFITGKSNDTLYVKDIFLNSLVHSTITHRKLTKI